jgi:uncharacterized RDD family membrane protein YckC
VAQGPPQLSPDGMFYWDGTRWVPVGAPQPRFAYGGVSIRFVAFLIDSFIIGIPLGVLLGVLAVAGVLGSPVAPSDVPPPPPGGTAMGAVYLNPGPIFSFWVLGLVVAAGYYVYFWGTSGSTLGMRLFELRVVDANTVQPIGIARAVLRYIGFLVAALPCWIGLIWAIFDPRVQGWHDKIASTVVLESRAAQK